MATCFNILAWKIPGREEPGGLQSMGMQRVRHDCMHTLKQDQVLFKGSAVLVAESLCPELLAWIVAAWSPTL